MDKNTRNSFLYIIGIAVLLGLLFVGISRFSDVGTDINSANRTYDEPPEQIIEEGIDYKAVIKTNYGDIEIDLLEENAPVTVNNFVFLAQDNFYDGVKFHRVVEDFVIQTGSRLSLDENAFNDGVGGPGYRFDNEINFSSLDLTDEEIEQLQNAGFQSKEGITSVDLEQYTVAMANAGPGTNGSQFFIVTAESDDDSIQALNGRHTVFARVTSGQDVVEEIEQVEIDPEIPERPREDVIVEEIEIIEEEK
jgi:peptidylprolyl isomerase